MAADDVDFHVMTNEAIGELKIDTPATLLKALIPDAPKVGAKQVSEADGLVHQTWKYTGLGLEIDMTSKNKKAAQSIAGITVKPPSVLQTRRGIHIGSREADVLKAYKGDISKEESQPGQTVVAGTVYGGVIFSIENGVVKEIFLGAAAE
jgi:hypothetical protein